MQPLVTARQHRKVLPFSHTAQRSSLARGHRPSRSCASSSAEKPWPHRIGQRVPVKGGRPPRWAGEKSIMCVPRRPL
jgi:hypothetical protein